MSSEHKLNLAMAIMFGLIIACLAYLVAVNGVSGDKGVVKGLRVPCEPYSGSIYYDSNKNRLVVYECL